MFNGIIKNWQIGQKINIESSLKIGDKLEGHKILGNVDSVANIVKFQEVENGYKVDLKIENKDILSYLKTGGFVAVDGISLNVRGTDSDILHLFLSPFTKNHTSFNNYHIGDQVNIEADYQTKIIVDTVIEEMHNIHSDWAYHSAA